MADAKLRGIYSIRNVESGRVYVGSAENIKGRWRAHRHLLSNDKHHSPTLQRSWVKHGSVAFEFAIVEVIEGDEALIAREQHWIDMLHAAHPELGFNVGPVAGSRKGVRHSAATIAAMSAARLGVPKSPEHRAKIGAAKLGQAKSPEHRAKLAISVAETMRTPERRAKSAEGGRMVGGWNKGMKASAEVCAKLSAGTLAALAKPGAKEARAANFNGKQPKEVN